MARHAWAAWRIIFQESECVIRGTETAGRQMTAAGLKILCAFGAAAGVLRAEVRLGDRGCEALTPLYEKQRFAARVCLYLK